MSKNKSKPYQDADILLGRGGRSNNHDGNKRYNRLIEANKIPYFLLDRNEDKGLFLKQIQSKLCDEEGRKFVELKNGKWEEATPQRIREKIRTALCDTKLKRALEICHQEIEPRVYWPDSGPFDQDEEDPLDDDYTARLLD